METHESCRPGIDPRRTNGHTHKSTRLFVCERPFMISYLMRGRFLLLRQRVPFYSIASFVCVCVCVFAFRCSFRAQESRCLYFIIDDDDVDEEQAAAM